MANLGNAWHEAANPEPRGMAGMRDPVFPTVDDAEVRIATGNQFTGPGNPGNQLQEGSALLHRLADALTWTIVPLTFSAAITSNKYYTATLPIAGVSEGTEVDYYLRIAYDDHDTTFLALAGDGMTSTRVADEATAQASPFRFTVETPAVRGRWDPPFILPNVAIHAHTLPNRKVLMWGRRDSPEQSLDVAPPSKLHAADPGAAPPATCTPFLLDPETQTMTLTRAPELPDGSGANLFCSGHAWLADGRLLVTGGHLADSAGLVATTVYDPSTDSWSASASMVHGRWYPTATTLADGRVLILSGSYRLTDAQTLPPAFANNIVPEIWDDGALTEMPSAANGPFDLYPRVHLISDATVVMTGSLQQTTALDLTTGLWHDLPTQRDGALRDYAPSVLYDVDEVIYIGGGNPPTASAETLNLAGRPPQWAPTDPMTFPRRQHNATILADGTVLVTGGTRSGGPGPPENFNNLDLGQPVHVAELWDPSDGTWTQLAAEATDRCYHATAVLLPDGRVLSAGGGEFFPVEGIQEENDPLDSHDDAQIFSPPYLFKGQRPTITSAPSTITLCQSFDVGCDTPAEITRVTMIRLSSTTHSFNTGQRFCQLSFEPSATHVTVQAPEGPGGCPPGPYLLFILNAAGVPSVAATVLVSLPTPTSVGATAKREAASELAPGAGRRPSVGQPSQAAAAAAAGVLARRERVLAAAQGTKVVIGLRGTCPYGIAACWGGAHEALAQLPGVQYVDPIADADSSTAIVFLTGDQLPPLADWTERFRAMVHDSYRILGVEVTVTGQVKPRNGGLVLIGEGARRDIALLPLTGPKVQQQRSPRQPSPPTSDERHAYATLVRDAVAGPGIFTVTGPLSEDQGGPCIQVRDATTERRIASSPGERRTRNARPRE